MVTALEPIGWRHPPPAPKVRRDHEEVHIHRKKTGVNWIGLKIIVSAQAEMKIEHE